MEVRYHVVQRKAGWCVERTAARRASATCATKREAVRRAKRLAARHGTSVLVHDKQGLIERELNAAGEEGRLTTAR